MSGQEIGTVVGGVIGAYFGMPQLGMAIGGMIGGAIDPTVINGPHIGDGQQQTATDGSSIAWVMGTATIAGTIVQVGPRREVKVNDSGKGSGTEVNHYEGRQDFAVLVCESSELRQSTISNIVMVQQDGKIVYDVRPGSTILEDSAKWKANVDFMFGAETQLPHPTLEAITGVGNTPAYRGSCMAVFKDFNITQAGNRIPSFLFTVVSGPLGAGANVRYDDHYWAWFYEPVGGPSPDAYAGVNFDYSAWPREPGMFATRAEIGGGVVNTVVGENPTQNNAQIWMRRRIVAHAGTDATITFTYASHGYAYWNGEQVFVDTNNNLDMHAATITVPGDKVLYANEFAAMVTTRYDNTGDLIIGANVTQTNPYAGVPTLDEIVSAISLRGGLTTDDIDVSGLDSVEVQGYPIAKQMTGVEALSPLLQAYFAFASDHDAKLWFNFYGANTTVTVDSDDLIQGDDPNDPITSNLRNNATEFPLRFIGNYYDPAQNYMPVQVTRTRSARDVIAIGDQTFSMPVVMTATNGIQAIDKAMKVAYATLEGTLEYSVPFAGESQTYLALSAGDPLQFQGKRWVVDEAILSQGYIKLTTRYDRQSAYTSSIQPILGLDPTPPSSPYSGPTTLIPMNLPSQRPQDSVGVYIAAASTDGRDSWRGCVVQISYDGQASWQNALTITDESSIGTIDVDEPLGGEPITVDMVKYDLENATSDQLAAKANAFAVTDSTGNVTQIGQFATASETSTDHQFEITDISRSLGGTVSTPVVADNPFTLMAAAYFLPIDQSFAGRTLYFRGVGFGEDAADAQIYPLVYAALINADTAALITEDGAGELVTEDGLDYITTE